MKFAVWICIIVVGVVLLYIAGAFLLPPESGACNFDLNGLSGVYDGEIVRDSTTAIRLLSLYYDESGLRDPHDFDNFLFPYHYVPRYVYYNDHYPVCFVDFDLHNNNPMLGRDLIGGQWLYCIELSSGRVAKKQSMDGVYPEWEIEACGDNYEFYFPCFLPD